MVTRNLLPCMLRGTSSWKRPGATFSSAHARHSGEVCSFTPRGKQNTSFTNTSVCLGEQSPGTNSSSTEVVVQEVFRGVPQMASKQGWLRALTLLVCRLPFSWQNDSMEPGLAAVVMSLQYLNCQQTQLLKFLSASRVTLVTSATLSLELDKAPNSVSIIPHLRCLALITLLCTSRQSNILHTAAEVGSPCLSTLGQQEWQLKTCLWSQLSPPGVSRNPPESKSPTQGSKNIMVSLSCFLISLYTFLQKGSRNLLLLTPGKRVFAGFLQTSVPWGSLRISQPRTLVSPAMYLATRPHISANLSSQPPFPVTKSYWILIMSKVVQNNPNSTFKQSSRKGQPFQSNLILIGRGAGKLFLWTTQSGNPSPHNFLLKRS